MARKRGERGQMNTAAVIEHMGKGKLNDTRGMSGDSRSEALAYEAARLNRDFNEAIRKRENISEHIEYLKNIVEIDRLDIQALEAAKEANREKFGRKDTTPDLIGKIARKAQRKLIEVSRQETVKKKWETKIAELRQRLGKIEGWS